MSYINVFCLTGILIIIGSALFFMLWTSLPSKSYDLQEKIDDKYYTKPSKQYSSLRSGALYVTYDIPYDTKDFESYDNLEDGDGTITGKVLLNNKPLSQTTLSLVFNEGNKGKDRITTDMDGIYKLKVPYGEYSFNGFIVYDERVKGKVSLQDWRIYKGKPENKRIEFDLNRLNNQFELPTLEIVDSINVKTIQNAIYSISNLDDDSKIVEWHKVKFAVNYKVEISRVTKERRGTSYSPITKRDYFTPQNILHFKEFTKICELFELGVYGVKIFAFDENKKLLTYTRFDFQIAFAE